MSISMKHGNALLGLIAMTERGEIAWQRLLLGDAYRAHVAGYDLMASWLRDEPPTLTIAFAGACASLRGALVRDLIEAIREAKEHAPVQSDLDAAAERIRAAELREGRVLDGFARALEET